MIKIQEIADNYWMGVVFERLIDQIDIENEYFEDISNLLKNEMFIQNINKNKSCSRIFQTIVQRNFYN